ncbi:ROK family transcriptional regulator [Brevibacillus fulvus]|uniref:Glucokinase-like ROK family protein n=1 Tax=Brevibacillus fulvus TaxID=1125967 RepID=A0A939BSB1_9BACL|nr:ROK family protein [Brevibacillus fulvus]MBM7590283.1 glucokinase-like ROK family protein [Brevibacillus fulvus]
MVNGMVGSFQLMKSLNKSLILNVIRTEGPISRAEIAKKTNLTPPTVTNIVGELLESNLVVESDLGNSTGGRKPIMLRINSTAFQVIGIDVAISHIRVIAITLDAQIIQSLKIKLPSNLTNEILLDLLIDAVNQIIQKADLQQQNIIGIGVGMHGLVNPDEGVSIYAPNLHLRQIPIRQALEEAFQIPVEVENDARAMALGESWFGNGQGVENSVSIYVGMGVGAGIILNHKLYRGASHTAGEMGHTTVDANGPKCSCGNYGCLEALVAGPAIVARTQTALREGRESIILQLAEGDFDKISGEIVYQAALQADPLALEILRDTGRYLGIGIANIINTLNPQKVIIGGGVSKSGEFILEALREQVQRRSLETPCQAVTIETAKLGGHATAIGAATLILRNLFAPEFS